MASRQEVINGGVNECLDSQTPFLCVSHICERLRDEGDWSAEEVDDIGVQIWHRLRQLLDC
jgi:hypothetical protein